MARTGTYSAGARGNPRSNRNGSAGDNSWMAPTSRIVVTGGAGFIGSATARLLLAQGRSVTIVDDLSTGHRDLIPDGARFIQGSLEDEGTIHQALEDAGAVLHFAASSIIARSFSDPMEYVRNNVVNGTRLLEAMRRAEIRHFVFSSSAAVYGEPAHIPVKEQEAKHPLQVYGATKLAFEQVLEAYYHAFGMNSVCLRYFNAYGPGDWQQPVTRAVPRWIQAALTQRPIKMFWKGEQCRDYVFVDDIAQAHLDVLGLDGFSTFNIGSGSGILMRDLALTLQEIVGTKLVIEDAGERPGDPMQLVADIGLIREVVGWEPRTTLRTGLQQAVEFYENSRPHWQPKLAD